MNKLVIPAYAKINLTLEVLRRLPSGYHEIASVMQEISLHDDVILEPAADGEIHLVCDNPGVPPNEQNLAWQAAELIRKTCGKPLGIKIRLHKRIPMGGGMGGGSANAAAVLLGLNQLWGLHLDPRTLQSLAQDLGMDVPFAVQGGTALATGRGEIITAGLSAPRLDLVIAHPGVSVSTAEAYRHLRLQRLECPTETERMRAALTLGSVEAISQCLYNDFEPSVFQRIPAIRHIKEIMLEQGALGALMCGSGASVFGVASSPDQARRIAATLISVTSFVVIAQTHQRDHSDVTFETILQRNVGYGPISSI